VIFAPKLLDVKATFNAIPASYSPVDSPLSNPNPKNYPENLIMKFLARPSFVPTAQSRYSLSKFIGAFLLLACCGLSAQAAPGDLDPSFGTNGKVITDFGSNNYVRAIAVQSDGKIVAAGNAQASHMQFALARHNPDGTLDESFGTGGKVTTTIGTDDAFAYAVALQSDGRIVAAGYIRSMGNRFALARYNTNGTLDTSFGTGGIVTTQFSSIAFAYALAIQPDGKIIAAGNITIFTSQINNDDFALARYNTNGTLDASFGTGGLVTTPI
jgi:uncharacterized delta-60 repeat protein